MFVQCHPWKDIIIESKPLDFFLGLIAQFANSILNDHKNSVIEEDEHKNRDNAEGNLFVRC